ncbi:MAG: pyridoxal phosphate-dependent aminotransferase [Proteobacteria bacterium]|nr:pyridoxal phosphate-dependent aminotransferase [Pseudomonadota bacterium]
MDRLSTIFRPVPRTGVIYVMTEAAERGFVYGHPDWANLGQGAPETGPLEGAPERINAIEVNIASAEYAPVPGSKDLREAVAALYNHRYRQGKASQYTAENVSICAGGRAALTRVAASLGSIHLGHLLPDYTAYEELLEVFRAFVPLPVVLQEEDAFTLTGDTLRRAIVGHGLGALLFSNPCNPTGQVVDESLGDVVSAARELGCALIVDEFYSHYIYEGPLGRTVSAAEHVEDVNEDPVVIVDGLTKNWRYPGLRLSWTVGPRDVIDRLASAGSFLDGGAPHPIQKAALPLLDPAVADAEASAIQRTFGIKRERMLARLEALGLSPLAAPGGAFYCFARLHDLPPPLNDGMAFFHAALDKGVICVPGVFFDVNPGKRRSHIPSRLQGYVRLSFGPELAQIERGLDRIEALVNEARAAK